MVLEIGIPEMDIYGYAQLVVKQIMKDYEVWKDDLIPTHIHADEWEL